MSPTRFGSNSETDSIGAHLSTKGGLSTIFDRAAKVGATTAAFFAKNSNQWKGKTLSDEDCQAFRLRRGGIAIGPLATHASYLINLCSANRDFREKSVVAMADELSRAERLGVEAVVLHPGAHMGAGCDSGVDQIARALDRIHAELPGFRVVTLLETSAGQGSCVGCSFDELGQILRLVDEPSRLGVCVDTCHIFAAGYDIRTREGYERTIDELERAVGLENVGLFHLNDSKRPLGSRVDRHEHIGKGAIGLDAFGFLLNDPRFRGLPKILETPKPDEFRADRRNLKTLRSLLLSEQSGPPRRRSALREPVAL